MEFFVSLLVPLVMMLVVLRMIWKFVMPEGVAAQVIGEIIHDAFQGIWHFIFGPPKVRVVSPRRRRRRRR